MQNALKYLRTQVPSEEQKLGPCCDLVTQHVGEVVAGAWGGNVCRLEDLNQDILRQGL